MIHATKVHAPLDVAALINDVVRCHTDMVQTVHCLKIQVAVMDTQNRHLIERVRILEENADKKSIETEDNKLTLTNAVAALHEMNNALTIRVALLERIAQETQAEEERAAEVVANQKRIADRCGELLKKYAQFPLHQAARGGDCNEVLDHFLLKLNFHVDAKNNNGRTPLHVAAWNGHSNVVHHLLSRGAGVDTKDNDGRTPLHDAAWNGRSDIVQHLLDGGAGIDTKDKDGKTPLRLAEDKGHHDVVALLESKVGK